MKSRGAAVLVIVFLLVALGVVSLVIMRVAEPELQYESAVADRLDRARRALIEYAVTYPQNYVENSAGPGKFPCPDSNGNGNAGPRCPALAVGFLPFDFRASAGGVQELQPEYSAATEPLIWVLAGPFRNRPAPSGAPGHSMIVNSDTSPVLQLDNAADVLGLLIAPGPPVVGQQRGQGRESGFRVEDYLEGENADGDHVFSRSAGNDRVVAIRTADVMPLVEAQVLSVYRDTLEAYLAAHGRAPYLAPLESLDAAGETACSVCQLQGWIATPRYRAGSAIPTSQWCEAGESPEVLQPAVVLPPWLLRNQWHLRVWLHLRDPTCGDMPSLDSVEVEALVASVGPPLDDPPSGHQQNRTAPTLADLLDHAVNTDGDFAYERQAGGNDRWITVQTSAE